MAKTIRTKVYQFQELSESAKENAIISNLTINTDYDWWNGVYEDASNVDIKITHFDIDINSIDIEMENYSHTANLIVKNHGKKCETYSVARSFLEGLDRLEKQKEYNEETEEMIYYEFHRRIKKMLPKSIKTRLGIS